RGFSGPASRFRKSPRGRPNWPSPPLRAGNRIANCKLSGAGPEGAAPNPRRWGSGGRRVRVIRHGRRTVRINLQYPLSSHQSPISPPRAMDDIPQGVVRKARVTDAAAIQRLVGTFAERDEMLPRSLGEIYENIRDFFVAEDDD